MDIRPKLNASGSPERSYLYYRRALQLFTYQMNGLGEDMYNPRRWMLKCPMHMFFIKELGKAFPDAKLIW
jgi:hypothetical protein